MRARSYNFIMKEFDEDGSVDGVTPGIEAYYFGARMYEPVVGIWMSVDLVNEYFSSYTYVGNNPISSLDPNGLWTATIGGGLGYGFTGKIGYNKGRLTVGFGAGQGAGVAATFDPATTVSHADEGLAIEFRAVADASAGLWKLNVGGRAEGAARVDAEGNYVIKGKGEVALPVAGAYALVVSHETAQEGNVETGESRTRGRTKTGQRATAGAFEFIGAETEVSGTPQDLIGFLRALFR